MNDSTSVTNENGLKVEITQMMPCHLKEVVQVHLASFDGFFLTFLGPRFLRLLYSELLKEPGSVTLIAQERDSRAVVGFVAGVADQSRFYKRLALSRAPAFAFASLQAVAMRPAIIPRLVRALAYPLNKQKSKKEAVLMSLAVHPKATVTGVGRNLVSGFVAGLQAKGATRITLLTDKDNNLRVNNFYKKQGFEIRQTVRTPEGRWMNEYTMDLKYDDLPVGLQAPGTID